MCFNKFIKYSKLFDIITADSEIDFSTGKGLNHIYNVDPFTGIIANTIVTLVI